MLMSVSSLLPFKNSSRISPLYILGPILGSLFCELFTNKEDKGYIIMMFKFASVATESSMNSIFWQLRHQLLLCWLLVVPKY